METTNETIEILQDLVEINNDRIAGYEHALKELKNEDGDLKTLFEGMIDESRKAKLALAEEIQVMGADVKNQGMVSGKIYRAWMDVKAVFTGHNRQVVLDNCHVGEDAAQKAYTTALSHEHLPAYIRDLVQEQKETFKASHDEIKALRDEEKVS